MNSYTQIFNNLNICYKENVDLSYCSYSRTGGSLLYACFPIDDDQFVKLIQNLNSNNLKYKVLGNTTNTLFLDSVEYTCFIYTTNFTEIKFEGATVGVSAGINVIDLVRDLAMRGFCGMEGLEGIPGTIGGAIRMNAGAYGYCISDYIKSVKIINSDNILQTLDKSEIEFSNRRSSFNKKDVIISVILRFPKGDLGTIEKKIRRFHISRHQYQEWVFPNLGSIYIIPSLNIHYDIINKFKSINIFKYLFFKVTIFLWRQKLFFILRRIFPEFNFIQLVMKKFGVNLYMHNNCSKTTPNTFANKNNSSKTILEYYLELKNLLGLKYKLENEPVVDCIHKVLNKNVYNKELDLLKKLE